MASRAEEKQRLKEERLKAEQAEQAKASRNRRLGILGAVGVIAAAVVVVVLVVTGGGKEPTQAPSSDTAALFDGIPQRGLTLGNPDAPVEVEEFLDLQCPVCKVFSETALPVLVNDYVRTGKVKLTMRPIVILGPDSQPAAETLLSATQQNRGWQFAETFYANQGPENSGYVTDSFLNDVATATPGLNAQRALSGRNADTVQQLFNQSQQRSQVLQVQGTPALYATKGDGQPQQLDISPGDAATVKTALDPIVNG